MPSTLRKRNSSAKKLNVLLLSSEWWSRKGGISTVNRILALQLAKHPSVKVTVFLLECSEEEKKEAAKHNITVLKAERQPGFGEEKVFLCFPPSDLQIDIVIGHGEKLGPPAKIIRENRQCRWVQIVHTIPKELGMFKGYGNPIVKSEMKHEVEVELAEIADLVVGVGPKLSEAFRCYLRWCKTNPGDVINLTPGIFNEYSNIQHALQDEKNCRVLIFGRDDEEDFTLKGFDITAKAIAKLPNTRLIFAGACNESRQQIADRFEECGISRKNLEVRGFLKSKQEFIQLFCEVDLALLPSRSDGFGLAALEALSAGLPVLVSQNTGFGEALSKVPFGSFYVIDSEDFEVWASAIEQVWKKNRATRLKESRNLRTFYGEEYNWESQCNDLVNTFRTTDIDNQEQETTGADVFSNPRGTYHSPMQERIESKPSNPWKGSIDKASFSDTIKQQIEDEADFQNPLREQKFVRAEELVESLADHDRLPERSGGGLPSPCKTHQHSLHVPEIIIREELSPQADDSRQEFRLESGTKIEQAKAEEDEHTKREAVIEELRKSLEGEQQLRARMEKELRQTRTRCTELEETVHELVQMCLTSQPDNDAQMLKGQERNSEENIILNLQHMLGEEQKAPAKTEADELAQVWKAYTYLKKRFVSLEQKCEAQMIANSYMINLRQQELREKETQIAELQRALDETLHAKLWNEKELNRVGEQELERERYVSVSREAHLPKIPREQIVLSEEILGRGAWGTVKIGTFRGCQVAVKQIHELVISPHNRALFQREMRIAFRCHHPNILHFIGTTFDDGSPLLVTELLDASLRNLLEERPLHLRETATIALDVAKGLNYLHLATPLPILHRDVKSANVLLWRRDQHWRAKLGDLGTASFMRSCMTVAPGTMLYSAPETITSNQTTKVDVYSFGVLLCEMCIREMPDPERRHGQILKVSSRAVRGLVQRCVSNSSAERPSMRDVIPFLSWREKELTRGSMVE